MNHRTKGRLTLFIVYILAIAAGTLAGQYFLYLGMLQTSAVAVLVTVAVIFSGSVVFNNSSVFDPYWSVAPPLMVLWYLLFRTWAPPLEVNLQETSQNFAGNLDVGSGRIIILFILIMGYGLRLTWNFLRGWPGLSHEDWRYVDFRNNSGKLYWLVSFSGIHLFPALMVFGGTLSIWVVIVNPGRPLNILDALGVILTGAAILLEAIADRQLRKFVRENKEPGKTMDKGLWSLSRHPNYLGEILFWWGLYLFALASNPAFWWVICGPAAITLMFLFASIPLIEKRMLKRRKDYADYRKRVSMLVPFLG
jgi:steroid 5-alpha reductase family enzyme